MSVRPVKPFAAYLVLVAQSRLLLSVFSLAAMAVLGLSGSAVS